MSSMVVGLGEWQGDLGVSLRGEVPITPRILARLPVTFELGVFAYPADIAADRHLLGHSPEYQLRWARHRRHLHLGPDLLDRTVVMIYPAVWWGWSSMADSFHSGPARKSGDVSAPGRDPGDGPFGNTMRMTRTMALEVLRQDYIRTAWSKGLEEKIVVMRHVLKNALIPVVTIVGFQLPIRSAVHPRADLCPPRHRHAAAGLHSKAEYPHLWH